MGSIRGEGGAGGGSGGGIAELLDDTTPQLGGNLDVNGFNVGGVTPTELGYISGVTSAVQTQLDAKATSAALTSGLAGKQDAAAELTALAGLTSAADKGIQFTGSGTAATYDLTAAGKALLDDADAAAQRTTLGLGTAATAASGDFAAVAPATSARNTITPTATNAVPLTLRAIASQTANALEIKDSSGTLIASISVAGSITLVGAREFNAGDLVLGQGEIRRGGYARIPMRNVQVSSGGGSDVALIAKGQSGQSGHLIDCRDSSDTSLARITSAGVFASAVATGTAPLVVASTTVVTNLNADKLDGLDASAFSLAINTPKIAYVETTGDNGTAAIGNPAKPYATLGAAVAAIEASAAAGVVEMGVGTFSTGHYDGAPFAYVKAIRGKGKNATIISGGGGFNFYEATPSSAEIYLYDLHVDSVGYTSSGTSTNGGTLTIYGDNAVIGLATSNGSGGPAGDMVTPGGNGGTGGNLFVRGRVQISDFQTAGGDGGADGGAGAGTPGTDGTAFFNGAILFRSGSSPTRYTAATCNNSIIESGYFGGPAYTDNGGNGTYS